jgi:hypothetical protein
MEIEVEAEPNRGKPPGIPTADAEDTDADSASGTTPPSRLPEPAKPLRGEET